MEKNITALAKELYIKKGKNLTEISEILGVSRQTIYNHKEKNEANSAVSWEELRLQYNRSEEDILAKETIFLNTLFNSFDKFLEKAKTNELSDETLEKLHIYAKSYYALKAPKQTDEKELTLKIAAQTIKHISDLAVTNKNEAVVKFLAEFSDEIIKAVFNTKK